MLGEPLDDLETLLAKKFPHQVSKVPKDSFCLCCGPFLGLTLLEYSTPLPAKMLNCDCGLSLRQRLCYPCYPRCLLPARLEPTFATNELKFVHLLDWGLQVIVSSGCSSLEAYPELAKMGGSSTKGSQVASVYLGLQKSGCDLREACDWRCPSVYLMLVMYLKFGSLLSAEG